MLKNIFRSMALPALLLPMAFAHAQIDHIVLSEVAMNGGPNNEGEYIEIFNPLTTAVDLSNYWIADSNNYKLLPADADGFFDTGTSDNIVRFPSGTMLPSGKVAVIVGKATTFATNLFGGNLANYTSQPGAPLLFEVTDSDAGVPNMEVHNNNATPLIWNFTNASATNGEFCILFYWDGVADLVKDVDIVSWGVAPTAGNLFAPKTPAVLGKNGTPYLQDNGSHTNLTLGDVSHATRISITEDSEVATGGNGLTGHDETTEHNSVSWVGGEYPNNATAGTTGLTVLGQNVPPLINSTDRDLQNPSSSQQITLTANVSDSDGTVAGVKFYVKTGAAFSPVTATNAGSGNWTAVIGPYANGTIVRYYTEATDDDGAITLNPNTAPTDFKLFIIDNAPLVPGDVVINEVLYDNIGGDAYEWVELHNTRNTEVKVPLLRFADGNQNWFVFPEDAVIPANGYVILTLGIDEFNAFYTSLPAGTTVYDWGTFGLNNNPEELFLVQPNGFDYQSTLTLLDYVPYSNVEPWPILNSNATGRSMELLNPRIDNSLPESWHGSVADNPKATPGAPNSVLTGTNFSGLTRTPEFPAASAPVTITANITGIGGATVSTVKLFVDPGTGTFTPTNMTLTATPNVYTGTIPGQPASTIVKYYIETTNNLGETGHLPRNAPTGFAVYLVGATAPVAGNVVINEILYDNFGGDAYEFVELYNTTASPIDLSYYVMVDNQNEPFTFPNGTSIAAHSYVVVTMDSFAFRAAYGTPSVPLLEWGTDFNLANGAGGDIVQLIHPNQFNFEGLSTPVTQVDYDIAAPWPNWTVAADSPNSTGRSIELINPTSPDRETGALWAWTTNVVLNDPPNNVVQGTPGLQNSVFSQSAVTDWSIY